MIRDNTLTDEEADAELYALDVLAHARQLADLALTGRRDAEAVIEWIYTYAVNAKVTYCCARGTL